MCWSTVWWLSTKASTPEIKPEWLCATSHAPFQCNGVTDVTWYVCNRHSSFAICRLSLSSSGPLAPVAQFEADSRQAAWLGRFAALFGSLRRTCYFSPGAIDGSGYRLARRVPAAPELSTHQA